MTQQHDEFEPTTPVGTEPEPTNAAPQPIEDWFAGFVTASGGAPQGEEIIDAAELERKELEAALEAARRRVEAARKEMSAKDAEMRSILRREVMDAKARLDDMERSHADVLQTVREAGRADAERIISEARSEVSRIRRGSTSGASDVG